MSAFAKIAFVVALAATLPVAAHSARPDQAAVDPERDPRLAQRVRVRADGIPVRWVLKALAGKTSVPLDAAGIAGDERLVAFVPEAPLAEVMKEIADLYRLTWSREERGGRLRYLLQKPARLANEERTLREQAFRQVMQRLGAQIRRPQDPDAGTPPESWTTVVPFLAPIVEARAVDILHDGYLYQPIATLPEAQREPLAARMQPVLEENHRIVQFLAKRIRQQREEEGEGPVFLAGEDQPAEARECTLVVELRIDRELRATVGLKTGAGAYSTWVRAAGDGTEEKALALYRDRHPEVPEAAGGRTIRETQLQMDRWTRPIDPVAGQAGRAGDWIASLRRVSEAAGIAVYADCYQDYRGGPDDHPRAGFSLSGRVVPLQALSAVCYPLAGRGEERLSANSFWWRNGDAALIRSRRWLWESAGVPPADLLDRLTRSLRATGQLSPGDLPALASLTHLQLQCPGFLEGQLDMWHEAVRVPAGLSPAARSMLLSGGLTWERLGPADRTTLVRRFPSAAGVPRDRYSGRLESSVESFPCQGGTVVRLSFQAVGGAGKEDAALFLPLPGVAPGKGLPPVGLSIEAAGVVK